MSESSHLQKLLSKLGREARRHGLERGEVARMQADARRMHADALKSCGPSSRVQFVLEAPLCGRLRMACVVTDDLPLTIH